MFFGIDTLVVNPANGWVLFAIIITLIWKLTWAAIALYRTLQLKQKTWFVIIFIASFILNDLGILAIIYLIITKDKKSRKPRKKSKKKK